MKLLRESIREEERNEERAIKRKYLGGGKGWMRPENSICSYEHITMEPIFLCN